MVLDSKGKMMNKWFVLLLSISVSVSITCSREEFVTQKSGHDLLFSQLANRWDEAIPLGNGMLGELVWQKGDKLRFSLDRADLWDLRPMANQQIPQWKYRWVYRQWLKKDYRPVQEKFDVPYDKNPAPSKIPAGAIEFGMGKAGNVQSVRLSVTDAVCEVVWQNGVRLLTFVDAAHPAGWFRFEGLDFDPAIQLIPPAYNLQGESGAENPVTGQDLRRLGYPKGKVDVGNNQITYNQEGWGGFRYQISVTWRKKGDILEGCWSISSQFPGWEKRKNAASLTATFFDGGIIKAWQEHKLWWTNFWQKSSVVIPDRILEKQWYLEQYKFGSAARKGAPPISLQAVWTADNGKLPPWKGDFHHDLNTQLSYWPAYSGNHLDLEEGFPDWLWRHRDRFKKYTRSYFETNGLNVPGVTTLAGEPMGGWIQYSFGPTVSAWLGQHFYLHWRYSMDRRFLRERAYPWLRDVAVYLDEISVADQNGRRKLPISSSPEINNNSRGAWFAQTTNFDLALIRWTYLKAAELAEELGKIEEAKKWSGFLAQWPQLDTDQTGLTFAPGFPYNRSHRHFSHQMAFHPLGLIDWSQGEKSREIIRNTLTNLEKQGSDWWTGYSFSWLGNLYARAFDGEKAARALKIFATAFCLPNSFHVNGDQSGKGYSKFTYRPFTLEGNFAFAAGIQEMLLQSHTGVVRVFPAVPESWRDAAFHQLRAEGAFLLSANRKNGNVTTVKITAEKGGTIKLKNPFSAKFRTAGGRVKMMADLIIAEMKPGQVLELTASE